MSERMWRWLCGGGVFVAVGWLAMPSLVHAEHEKAQAFMDHYAAREWTCVPQGRKCTFSSDCCSKNCVNDPKIGKVCKPKDASWTCVPQGRKCTFSSDCCSKNCVNDPKIGKVCKPQGASWTCVPLGRKCTFPSDCCSKNCVGDPKLGKVCKPPRK